MIRTTARFGATLAVGACLLWMSAGRSDAVVTGTWVVDTYKNFDEGEADNAFITSLGEVRAGWATQRSDLEFSGSWAAVRGSDGTIYIGSDDEGAIYAARSKSVKQLARIESAVAIVSLALADNGTLYAGTMPGGEVWSIDKSGKANKLAALKDVETVWALSLSPDQKTLYAGTGPNGKLFAISTSGGKSRVVFSSDDKRIMSTLVTGDGAVWFGTSDKALVFRHDPNKKITRAIADFAGNEVSALAEYQGGVVAAANDLTPPTTSGVKTKEAIDKAKKKDDPGVSPKTPKTGEAPGADKKAPSGTEPPRKGKRKGKGALYRIRGDGQLTQLHALTDTYFTSVAVAADGRIFAGAADKGRIYLVDTDDSVSTAFDVEQRLIAQVLVGDKADVAFITGDSAAVYRTTGLARNAVYTSDVFDAKSPSKFGKLVWRGSGAFKLETRTGNTAKPGVGWSRWQSPKGVRDGGGQSRRGTVNSPAGRYLQYRVTFTSQSDVLAQTTLFYLPHNRPTTIESIEITSEDDKKKGLITMASGAAKPRSPVLKLKWTIDNEDKDATEYRLEVRREGDVRWRRVATPDDFTKTEFEWNTETFPDGWYRLRVVASDRRQNSPDRVLESHKTTPLFLVDNQKPSLTGLSVRYPAVSAQATDAMSVVSEMAYSVDDGPWQVGATRDGLFDDTSEMLTLRLPEGLKPGVHTLAIRVADEAGNIGSTSTSFTVGR